MTARSAIQDAAICALHGSSDWDAVRPVFGDPFLSSAVALCDAADPVVRAIAALSGGLPGMLSDGDRNAPAVHRAIQRLIGAADGDRALWSWSKIAPGDWGADCRAALRAAVGQGSAVAAAFLPPDDDVAAVLIHCADIVRVICRWGRMNPAHPTWWMEHLSAATKDRLLAELRRSDVWFAECTPWLPPEESCDLTSVAAGVGIEAFAAAPAVVRVRQRARLNDLIGRATSQELGSLVTLARTMRSGALWRRIRRLLHESPDDAFHVVIASPWRDLPCGVRADIQHLSERSWVCRVITAAQGLAPDTSDVIRPRSTMTGEIPKAFFGALDPAVWDRLPNDDRSLWLDALGIYEWLAVRSLGLRTEVLARGSADSRFIEAARRHVAHDAQLRRALFPVALRSLRLHDAHALIAALPVPDDPLTFFSIASGRRSVAPIDRAWAAVVSSSRDLATAVVMQRAVAGETDLDERCSALAHAIHGSTWPVIRSLLGLLPGDERELLAPDVRFLALTLAKPARYDVVRNVLHRLANEPPHIAVPAFHALTAQEWKVEAWGKEYHHRIAADATARMLHAHGDWFLTLAESLVDDVARALLPLPTHPLLATAIRRLARDHPVAAHRFAHAMHEHALHDALDIVRDVSSAHASAIIHAALADAQARLPDIAEEGCRDDLMAAWQRMVDLHPEGALALAALALDMPSDHPQYAALLAARPEIARMVVRLLRAGFRDRIMNDALRIVVADLSTSTPRRNEPRWLR